MLPVLDRNPLPDWLGRLGSTDVELPIENILRGSVFYPASHLDGRPVQYLGGYSHSFVLVDCNVTQEEWNYNLDTFRGYRWLTDHSKDMTTIKDGKTTYRSVLMQEHINCASRSAGHTSTYYYSGNMAKGGVVDSYNFKRTEMATPPPNSVGEAVFIGACNIASEQSAPPKAAPKLPKKPPSSETSPF